MYFLVVPTKQCGSIISISYIACLLAAHSEKSGVCKVKQGSILKPALLCRDYLLFNLCLGRSNGIWDWAYKVAKEKRIPLVIFGEFKIEVVVQFGFQRL